MSSEVSIERMFEFEEDEYDDEELDLVKLVSNNANDLNQYLVFQGSNSEWYAMNVSKIEEILVYDKSIDIVHNNDNSTIICGTADIRNIMTTLIYFDDWYGNKRLNDDEYELIVLASYGGHKLGIIVRSVANISTIEASEMTDNSQNNTRSTFIAKVSVEGESHMCTIYDGDKMLLDIFDSIEEYSDLHYDKSIVDKLADKMVFLADDSKFVRNLVEKLFNKIGIKYKIFTDGSYLLEYLRSHPHEKVDLFITDLEMPNIGGREVIATIRTDDIYNDVQILIHTNMSNSIMETELIKIGANSVIAKIDMNNLGDAIIRETLR